MSWQTLHWSLRSNTGMPLLIILIQKKCYIDLILGFFDGKFEVLYFYNKIQMSTVLIFFFFQTKFTGLDSC